ncbi:hypothetical protein [Sorangium cellulosum]|uniref:hypothetical protein n=1 Tax=Sorangium cellulosum TaxID=56 RepID=UPI0018F88F31|nr:hypothetical protein [Sorangium cellulosum]
MYRNLSCTTTQLALAALSAIAAGLAACSSPPDDSANLLPSTGLGTCGVYRWWQHSSQPIAVAFTARGRVVFQFREPARIEVRDVDTFRGVDIDLPGDSVMDPGHALFHEPPSGSRGIACASCHPEAHEDGHTWRFDKLGLRRTQTVAGGVLKTAPFHWSGDQSDLTHLMQEVFVSRMRGSPPAARDVELLGRFLDNVPAFPASPPRRPGRRPARRGPVP